MPGYVRDDAGPCFFRLEGVFHPHRNSQVHRGLDGRGVDHLRSEVGELGCLPVADPVYGPRGFRDARVGGHDPRHVRPDLHFLGAQRRAHDGGRVVRAAAPERRRGSASRGGDEALHDGDHPRFRPHSGGNQAVGEVLDRHGGGEVVIGFHKLAGIEELGFHAATPRAVQEDDRRQALPEGEDCVIAPLRPFLEHHERFDDRVKLRADLPQVLLALRECRAAEERTRAGKVPLEHPGEYRLGIRLPALADQAGDLLELIGHLGHGGGDEHGCPLQLLFDDGQGGVHHFRVLYRRATELEDDHTFAMLLGARVSGCSTAIISLDSCQLSAFTSCINLQVSCCFGRSRHNRVCPCRYRSSALAPSAHYSEGS